MLKIDFYYYMDIQVFGGKCVKSAFTQYRVAFGGFRVFLCPFYLEHHCAAVSEFSQAKK